jgi:ACS family hexuronate transporter-like MFS transporter
VALIATLTMTVSYVDRTTLAVLSISVTEDLGISESEYGWLQSAFSIAYLIATPVAGWWIDRIGARRGLGISVLVWSGVAALHAIAPGFGVLLALRVMLGMAEGPGFPGAAQTVQRVLSPQDRPRGFGVLFTGSSIGAMVAPLIAAFLFGLAGWRVAFLGTAMVGLLWIPLWVGVTSQPDVRAQLDAPARVAAVPGPRVSFRVLVKHPIMIRALIAVFAIAPIPGFLQAWGAKYLARTFDVKQVDVGHYLWLPPLLFDVGAILFGDLASRQVRRPGAPPRMLAAFGTLLAASLVLLPLADSAWRGVALGGVAMAGSGAMYTLVTADLLGRVPPDRVSLAGGILAGAQSVALFVANPLIGRSVDYYKDYDLVAIVIGAWAIPGAVIWIVWRPADRV